MTLLEKLAKQEQQLLDAINNGAAWDADDIDTIIFSEYDLVEQECTRILDTYRDMQHDMKCRLIEALEAMDKKKSK